MMIDLRDLRYEDEDISDEERILHDIIYLQVCEDEESEWLGEVTWCQDRVNNDDVKYIRADLVKQQLAAKQAEVDALMLEYCPSEMSQEQLDTWAAHQRPAKED